jgi:hypothetical protein
MIDPSFKRSICRNNGKKRISLLEDGEVNEIKSVLERPRSINILTRTGTIVSQNHRVVAVNHSHEEYKDVASVPFIITLSLSPSLYLPIII